MTTAPAPSRWGAREGLALFLASLSILSLELVLVRIFSVLMWYHFVSLIVSLALFGLAASGLAVFLASRLFSSRRAGEWMGLSALALSGTILLDWAFFWFLGHRPLVAYKILAPFHQPFYEPFGPSSGGYLSWEVAGPLTLVIVLAALPFVAGGFVTTFAIWRHSESVSRVYFADLAGAGAGCVVTIALLSVADPFASLGVLAAVSAAAALLFFPSRAVPLLRATAWGALALSITVAAITAGGDLVKLNFVRGRYEPGILWSRWNSFSRVAVYPLRSGQSEGSWGVSRRYRGPVPRQMGVVVDDTGYSSFAAHTPGGDLGWARETLFALPYAIREKAEALVIGPGGGKEILVATSMGAARVKAVEINPLMVQAVNEEFADFSGSPYSLPGVEAVIDEGRTFLRRDADRYDVIQATVVYGRLAPSAGAFTLTEDHLYTLEAFHDYLDRLEPGGLLAFSRFLFEKRILRMVATAREAIEGRGAERPGEHFFIAAERGMATVLVNSEPFLPAETEILAERCRRLGFDVLYSPAARTGNHFDRLLQADDAGEFTDSLAYDISPVTDDRPFFYYLLRPGDFFRSFAGLTGPDFDDRALILIRNLLAVMLAMLALFLFLPLFLRRREVLSGEVSLWPVLLFFASLGLGFIVVEITLLKRFILLLGKPVYSVAVILATFLIAGGIGSRRARRAAGNETALRRRCALLVALLLFADFLLPSVIEAALPLGLPARLAVTILSVAPLGYLMGQPFPLGVALLRARGESLIPWVWAVNGAFSVVGSMLTLVLAINFGYTVTMLVGPAAYLAAAAVAEDLAGGKR